MLYKTYYSFIINNLWHVHSFYLFLVFHVLQKNLTPLTRFGAKNDGFRALQVSFSGIIFDTTFSTVFITLSRTDSFFSVFHILPDFQNLELFFWSFRRCSSR